MQKTPWLPEEQADILLNYLPLRNVLIQGIKATVKNKALPDSTRLCCTPHLVSLSLSLSLSLSPSQTWPHQGWSHVSSLPDAVYLEGTPWILPWLDPSKLLLPIPTSPMGMIHNGPDGWYPDRRSGSQLRTQCLNNLIKVLLIFAPDNSIIFIILLRKHTCSLPQRKTLSLSSRQIATQTSLRRVWNKDVNVAPSNDLVNERHMETCLPLFECGLYKFIYISTFKSTINLVNCLIRDCQSSEILCGLLI